MQSPSSRLSQTVPSSVTSLAPGDIEAEFWRNSSLQLDTATGAEGTGEGKSPYTPLEYEDSIRLLCLEPGSGPLRCRLVPVRLSSLPQGYESISYVWGNANDLRTIICNGLLVRVTRSLRYALAQLRRPDHDFWLWADGLCINQQDNTEKNHQVQLMGDIYAGAVSVNICLGETDKASAASARAALYDIWHAWQEYEKEEQSSM